MALLIHFFRLFLSCLSFRSLPFFLFFSKVTLSLRFTLVAILGSFVFFFVAITALFCFFFDSTITITITITIICSRESYLQYSTDFYLHSLYNLGYIHFLASFQLQRIHLGIYSCRGTCAWWLTIIPVYLQLKRLKLPFELYI